MEEILNTEILNLTSFCGFVLNTEFKKWTKRLSPNLVIFPENLFQVFRLSNILFLKIIF